MPATVSTTTVHADPPHRPPDLPRDLPGFRGYHAGATIVVCGCGESLGSLAQPERFLTIGVNDVGRLFQPDYLVVVNPPGQFGAGRFRYVAESRARAVFTQLDLGIPHPHVVRFRLGRRGGTNSPDPGVLPFTSNSPYMALCLALHMGASRIGIIGVDFTDGHFFGATGRHPLLRQLPQIDREYHNLYDECRRRGVEVINLSPVSRLTAFPKLSLEEFAGPNQTGTRSIRSAQVPRTEPTGDSAIQPYSSTNRDQVPKVFGVNYCFLACGDVFSTGLRKAAEDLGLIYESALWDDPKLPAKVDSFQPDLIFVVHGRRFVQKWGRRFSHRRTAVWLLDEPYEVDDTAKWSSAFETVFVNDPSTLQRHQNAHYLPVCFNPRMHCDRNLARIHKVGFVGGFNTTREQYLEAMAEARMLSYVVGGPWRSSALRGLCRGNNISPERTAELYQQTQVVVNVFRDVHHFNRDRVPARSMNPRIYEALACGALVLSERRPEVLEVFPDLPTFETPSSMLSALDQLLSDERHRTSLLEKCRAGLARHSYSDRLPEALRICLGIGAKAILKTKEDPKMDSAIRPVDAGGQNLIGAPPKDPARTLEQWVCHGNLAETIPGGVTTLSKRHSDEPGSETGLVSAQPYNDLQLSFDLWLDPDTWFIAKIHQLEQFDQKSNSYHLVATPKNCYLAKHNNVMSHLPLRRETWQTIGFRWVDQLLEVFVDGVAVSRKADNQLQSGYCFLGLKGGMARLRNIQVEHVPLHGVARRVISTGSVPRQTNPNKVNNIRNGQQPHPGAQPWPFTAMPRRNILYHIWPVRGSMWRWNLDELKSRLDLFNGRRIVSIVHDDRSEAPERVQEYLQGHGCEFLVGNNDLRGEVISFPLMMKEIASEDPNEVTFYGHAKGVKYEPNVPAPVRRWSEVQYRVALDDWMTVRDHLERFAMTGPFRMLGRFRAHRQLADWHYSGTYFWMRNAQVFSRNYLDIPQFYGGVETWPGSVFRKDETACLFMDNLRQLPYHEEFWRRSAEPAFKVWEAGIRPVLPPSDLLRPLPYKGSITPRMEQKPDEFGWWVGQLLKAQVSRVLTIGAKEGGVEWHLAKEFFEQGRKIEITAIDNDPQPQLFQTFREAERCFDQSLKLVTGDSTSASVREQLTGEYDAVFIDGDHSYSGCLRDFRLAESMGPRLIGLHDIVDSDWHVHSRCCVARVWSELSQLYRTDQITSGEWGGIGLVVLNR